MTTDSKSFSTLVVAVVLFGLAGVAIAALIPLRYTAGTMPDFTVFLGVGLAIIVLTAGLFGYIDRLGVGFGGTALVLATGYNALIAAVKLGLAPAALYEANREQSFDTYAGDPNSPWFYLAVGTVVLFLYLGVFRVMYGLFKRRFQHRAGLTSGAPAPQARGLSRRRRIVVAVTVAVVGILAAVFWIVPVFFVALPTLSYLTYVFTTLGAAIALALGLAAVLAYKTFDEVEKQAARLGDATLLASFFWLGLALILLYHVMWAVFLLTLASIWPFRTYTPK